MRLYSKFPIKSTAALCVTDEDALKRPRALQRDARVGKRGCHHCRLYESIRAEVFLSDIRHTMIFMRVRL